jgi:hypothetical protein
MTNDISQTVQGLKPSLQELTIKAVDNTVLEAKSKFDELGDLAGESGQNIHNLTNGLTQSVSNLNEATARLKTSVSEVVTGATTTINETTNRASSAIKETTSHATGALNDATNLAVHRLNDATNSITQTAEKTRLALDETLQKAEQLSGAITKSVQDVFATSVNMWMSEHPTISWIVSHPLWTVALFIITLFLGWGLLGAIAQFTQNAWLSILQVPVKLAQSLFGGVFQLLKRTDPLQLTETQVHIQQDAQKRIPEILARLETLRQEQDSLMREMNSILISKQ